MKDASGHSEPDLSRTLTLFAPAERDPPEELAAAARIVAESALLSPVLDAAGVMALVLNQRRQILFANVEVVEHTGLSSLQALQGLRPGEALGCAHASEMPGGCGASGHCTTCGVVLAFLSSQASGAATTTECLLTVRRNAHLESLEFAVKATPIRVGRLPLTVVSLRDVSHEKRREALEQVFFHDVLNTITGLQGYTALLQEPGYRDREQFIPRLAFLCDRLQHEVESQRTLLYAEAGTLELRPESTNPDAILQQAADMFLASAIVTQRQLEVIRGGADGELVTDGSLLLRVLTNMVKNALETVTPGQQVRVWAEGDDRTCTFSVWNEGVIPTAVALQIFRRSFSTKATRGRGLGTYSMKLLGERYLGGVVQFTSSAASGTVFSIRLPRQPAL
jgi:hypothetical protein